MTKELWWKQPLRILQTNLQVKDTPLMDPVKIVEEIELSGSNALVFNVGGIYAWYPSKVPFQHVNEYLPAGRDLLEEVITECHKRNIRFIARFDFSKAEDMVYQQRPDWFVRYADGSTRMYGKDRPGNWSLLVTTCLNAGYRNEEVAVPVIEEVLDRYDIDGIFFNAPSYEFCRCDTCQQKYIARYGIEMPEFSDYGAASPGLPEGLKEDWPSACVKDNIKKIYGLVKERAADVPVILYYNGPGSRSLSDRIATADLICSESQDVLSRGCSNIPAFWHPAVNMKVGRSVENYPMPLGIIHSCPGMDWRHTGLPTAEYEAWMCQIPANGGSLWHSVTGFADTISDKRIFESIGRINRMIMKIEHVMQDAHSEAELLLLWDGHAGGLAGGLINLQRPFDVACGDQLTAGRLSRYKAVIAPEGFTITEEISLLLKEYVRLGGNLLVESGKPDKNLREILGTGERMSKSNYLIASYLRFRNATLQKGLENTPLIAHRGTTWYCRPEDDTTTLATLVPPFAPPDAVGSPPERASILCPDTDIPLVLEKKYGKGKAIYLSFGLGSLIREYGLNEHTLLLDNLVSMLIPEPNFRMKGIPGLQTSVWRNGNKAVVHLVNGVGQRPLAVNIPIYDMSFEIKVPSQVKSVKPVLEDTGISYKLSGGNLHVTVDKLTLWNAILIEWQSEE